jgi:hypothetical protein
MANPTRYTSGISTVGLNKPLSDFPLPDETGILYYQNDFFTYAASDWTVIASGSGSTALNDGTLTGGGSILLTWGTSGNQANTLASKPFRLYQTSSTVGGTKLWFESSIVVGASATVPNYQLGLIAGTAAAVTDGIYFTKAAAASTWSIVLKSAAGSTTTIALPSTVVATAATAMVLGYYYKPQGNPELVVFYNGNIIGTIKDETLGTAGSLGTAGANNLANLPALTVGLAPSFLVGTGGTLEVDYVTAGCETYRL